MQESTAAGCSWIDAQFFNHAKGGLYRDTLQSINCYQGARKMTADDVMEKWERK